MANLNAEDTAKHLLVSTTGFDALFSNDLEKARQIFGTNESPFHLLGAGVCSFLEAALGMEREMLSQASQLLSDADTGAKKQAKYAKSANSSTRYPAGTEWELLQSDAILLHALTLALNETYMGYLQCFYELNNAHSRFNKLFKTVFPSGVDDYATPATSKAPSPSPSIRSDTSSTHTTKPASTRGSSGFFGSIGRFGGSLLSPGGAITPAANPVTSTPDGPVEELIMSGTAFGESAEHGTFLATGLADLCGLYGKDTVFNLVFSLLPAGARSLVGVLGFKHDRRLALKALAVSANQADVHAVFSALVLMTYYGVVLLLAGYQADEQHILKQYSAILDRVEPRYPTGSLWILNRAKLLRMSYDPNSAIQVLRAGLEGERPMSFQQADGLIIFELAWTLLSQRQYEDSAKMFLKMTEVNSWSHVTYYFLAASCYVSIGNYEKAQELYDAIPALLEKIRKIGGKDLPTEVLIKKKIAFYKEKQKRLTGSEDNYVKSIKLSPAEEIGIFWNTHARITPDVVQDHIDELTALTPAVTITSPLIRTSPSASETPPDLDTPDELAIRSLLLGIVHRTANSFAASRAFLEDALQRHKSVKASTWVGGIASFELAVLDLKEADATYGTGVSLTIPTVEDKGQGQDEKVGQMTGAAKTSWRKVLKSAGERLDHAMALAPQSVDLSSRLDTRVSMLRDEIATKRDMVEQS